MRKAIIVALSLAFFAESVRAVPTGESTDVIPVGTKLGVGTSSPSEVLTVNGNTALKNQSSAPTATTNYGKIYVNGTNLYYKDSVGTESKLNIATGTASGTVSSSSISGILSGTQGGTGVSNSGSLNYGANNITFTTSGVTGLTLPTTGTLATLDGTETLTNKILTSPTLTTPTLGAATATSITNALGSVGSPSYTFSGDTNTGLYSSTADTLNFVTGGTGRLTVDSTGNVGIGSLNPQHKLDVVGTINGDGLRIATYNSLSTITSEFSGQNLRLKARGGDNPDLVVATSGNVGIGSASPQHKLDVAGTINGTALRIGTTTLSSIDSNVASFLSTPTSANLITAVTDKVGTGHLVFNGSPLFTTPTLGAATATSLAVPSLTTSSGNMTIVPATGYLAIGTTAVSPAYNGTNNSKTLFVSGSSTNTDVASNDIGIVINNANTTENNTSGLHFSSFPIAAGDGRATIDASIVAIHGPRGTTQYQNGQLAFLTSSGFDAAPAERMRISRTGNVGIGTTTPAHYLHVESPSRNSSTRIADFLNPDTGAGAQGFIVVGQGSRGATFGADYTGNYSFWGLLGASPTVHLKGGNLGIGTSNPQHTLDVAGTINGTALRIGTTTLSSIDSNVASFLSIPSSANLATAVTGETGSGALVFGTSPVFTAEITTPSIVSSGALGITPATGSNLNVTLGGAGDFAVNANQLYVDTSAGNVGIGTTSPLNKLHTRNGTALQTVASTVQAGSVAIGMWAMDATATGAAIYRTTGSPLKFGITGNGISDNGWVEQMRIESSGNVGIGTTGPITSLEVVSGSANAGGDYVAGNLKGLSVVGANSAITSTAANLYISTNDTLAADIGGSLAFGSRYTAGSSAVATYAVIKGAKENATDSDMNGYLAFAPRYGFATNHPVERMRITSAGNVGIGTDAPTYTLHVVGEAYKTSGTSAWQIASDIRLKDIHGDYTHGLADVLKLHPVKYSYKKDNTLGLPSDKEIIGFVAQEVQALIPEAVHERSDGYLELNVDPIHWAVVKAIQELYDYVKTGLDELKSGKQTSDAELAQLRSELNAEKARSARLESDVASLKAAVCGLNPSAAVCLTPSAY